MKYLLRHVMKSPRTQNEITSWTACGQQTNEITSNEITSKTMWTANKRNHLKWNHLVDSPHQTPSKYTLAQNEFLTRKNMRSVFFSNYHKFKKIQEIMITIFENYFGYVFFYVKKIQLQGTITRPFKPSKSREYPRFWSELNPLGGLDRSPGKQRWVRAVVPSSRGQDFLLSLHSLGWKSGSRAKMTQNNIFQGKWGRDIFLSYPKSYFL